MNKIYVLAGVIGPLHVSTDLEVLKRHGEKKVQWDASEFKWERDGLTDWTDRLLLRYVSTSTGRWNKSGYFIDRVPLLDAEEGEK